MSTFKTFWGELDVDPVETPAAAEPVETDPPAGDPPAGDKPETPEEGDTSAEEGAQAEPTGSEGEEGAVQDPTPSTEDEPESIEWDEDDVAKSYTMLIEQGVIPELDDEAEIDATPEGLAGIVAEQIRNGVQTKLAETPEPVKQLYSFLEKGGDIAEFTFEASSEIDWENVDLTDDDVAKSAIVQQAIATGLTPEEAEEEAEDAEVSGRLQRKAGIAAKSLAKAASAKAELQASKAAKAAKAREDARQKEIDDLEASIDNATEIAGIPIDAKMAKKFKDHVFKVDKRTGKTQLEKNMNDRDRILTTAFLDYVNYSGADIEKTIENKLTIKRKKRLSKYTGKGTKTQSGKAAVKTATTRTGPLKIPKFFGSTNIETED